MENVCTCLILETTIQWGNRLIVSTLHCKYGRMEENKMELAALVAQLRDVYFSDRKVAFFGASGISKNCPTHLPLGGELGQAVISGFFEGQSTRDLTLLREAAKRRTLEELCGVIQRELEHKELLIAKMAQVLDHDEIVPNYIHRLLAKALHDGHLVVTTNYETLVERAYQDLYGTDF